MVGLSTSSQLTVQHSTKRTVGRQNVPFQWTQFNKYHILRSYPSWPLAESVGTEITPGLAINTDASSRRSLAAVSGTHRFQAGYSRFICLHGLAPRCLSDIQRVADSNRAVSGRRHPELCYRAFDAASDPMHMAVHCWRSCISGGWKPPLEQSADRRHLNSNADCFSEPPQNLSLFPIIFFLTVFGF